MKSMGSVRMGLATLLMASALSGQQRTARKAAEQSPARQAASSAGATTVVFDGVTVVDVEQGTLVPQQRVVIVGTRIRMVGAVPAVALPRGARVVDGRGKYLIPGLWDMHVTTWDYPQVVYPLAIANGVTGVREMSHGNLAMLAKWRREIAAGTRVGPRAFVAGAYLGKSATPEPLLELSAGTPDEAVARVRSLKAGGADFISVTNSVPREAYFAALAEARRLGVPVAGIPPKGITLRESSDSGQRTVGGVISCPIDAATEERCAALAAQLRRNGTWLTPTLVSYRYLLPGLAPDRLQFWPYTTDVRPILPFNASAKRIQEAETKNTTAFAMLVRAGMPLLAGTAAAPIFPENLPGVSLHEELALFVKAGMTPAAALQTATLNPALAMHATDSLGTVAKGKLADLVLLAADPLADVANLDKIDAVVANGRYFTRAQLDALVADVKSNGRTAEEAREPWEP